MNLTVLQAINFAEYNIQDLLICGAIGLIPLLISLCLSKRYNVIHGIISFFFFSYLLFFVAVEFGSSLTFITTEMLEALNVYFGLPYHIIYNSIELIPGIDSLMSNEYIGYILITALAFVFLFSQFFASYFRNRKIR